MIPNVDETDGTVAHYRGLLSSDRPVLDVRSPSEFALGAVPSARNFPILTDDERAEVGLCFKRKGREQAYALGMRLVSGDERERRVGNWLEFVETNRSAVLCCWRGGLRSRIAQAWLSEAGVQVPVLAGGSKALRRFCLAVLEQAECLPILVLSGRTGVGKTELLKRDHNAIDLENLAAHRGSAFGGLASPQPPPVSFDARLVRSILRADVASSILVEDESRNIGRLAIPADFRAAMAIAPVVVIEAPMEERIDLTYRQYVRSSHAESMLASLDRIERRLGGELHRVLRAQMQDAYQCEAECLHRRWIAVLLERYYDAMYDYQLDKKRSRIVFSGSRHEVSHWLEQSVNRKANLATNELQKRDRRVRQS